MEESLTTFPEPLIPEQETAGGLETQETDITPLTIEFEPLEEGEEGLHAPPAKEGLRRVNSQLANAAEKLVATNQLDGLLLLGLGGKAVTVGLSFLEKEPLEQQAAGTAIIRRLEQILPERFQGDSPQPFTWKDPNTGNNYRFELTGGEAIEIEGERRTNPRVLRGIEVSKQGEKEVFLASTQDFQHWRIEQCDFTFSQVESLSKARRQVDAERSPLTVPVQAADSFCL